MLTSLQKHALKTGVVLTVFLVGFLLGYIPQKSKLKESNATNQQLLTRISKLEEDLEHASFGLKLALLRDQLSLLHMEVLKKNYGNATQMSSQFFNGLREAIGQAKGAVIKDLLSSLLQNRDRLTASLAKGDPDSLNQIQEMLIRFHQFAK